MQTILIVYGLFAIFWFIFFCKTSENKTSVDIILKVVISMLWGIIIPITTYACMKETIREGKKGKEKENGR